MTPSETVAILGNTLDITYFDGSDYQTTQAVYVGADVAGGVDANYQQTDYLQTGLATVIYKFSGSVVNDPNYVSVDFSPLFALLDVDQVHTVLGITATGSDISTSPWTTPQWIWTCAGERTVFSGRADYGLHYRCQLSDTFAHGEYYDYIPVDWVHQGSTSAFSQRAVFSYAQPAQDGYFYLAFGCPYITDLGSIDTISGTTGTTSSNSSGTVIVDVDLEETNTLLDGILDVLGGVVSGIGGLFIPDEHVFSDFWDDLELAIYDKLDPLYTVVVQIDRVFTNIRDTGAGTHFHIDGVTFPVGGGQYMTLGNWDVPIVPDIPGNNLPDGLMWTCKRIISIVCTLAFVNMCKDKISLFFNPDAERIE